jgi:transposase
VPKQHSSGGKDRLGSISKQGDRYLGRTDQCCLREEKLLPTRSRPHMALSGPSSGDD